jgi:MFS family permease
MAEFFDFFVFGLACVLVFPAVFFQFTDRLTGTLYAFAVFSLAFIARPWGSVIFMTIDRLYGRSVKLTMALFLLGGSTVAISFLPGYQEIGPISIALLCLARIGQGLAVGGSWDGLASLLALNAPENKRGWYAMIPQLGAPLGFLLAAALFAFSVYILSAADFLDFGWRYPFFVAFAINVVALFARLRLVVTPEFVRLLDTRELKPAPITRMMRTQGRNVMIGAFVPLASFALFYLVTIFPVAWISMFNGRPTIVILCYQMVGSLIGAVGVVASGLIADRVGRRTLIGACAVLIGIFSLFAPLLLRNSQTGEIIFLATGFLLLGLSFGQAAGTVTSNFTAANRYSGAAFTSDWAWILGAGFAPLIVLGLSSQFGLIFVTLYLLSGMVCTLLALRINKLEQKH